MNAIHAPNSDIIYPHFLAGNSNVQPSPTVSASNSLNGTVAAITSSSVNASLVNPMPPEWDKQEIEQTFGSQVEEVFNQYNTIDRTFFLCDINII